MPDYDFSGWATRANIKCSDGRIIMKDAFKNNDGQKVPLVWNHQHNSQDNVLGHALLENRDAGVYAYCKFNDTEAGKTAKLLVEHGDIDALSIYANQLKEKMSCVIHGNIREVSLVLAGANIGAHIDNVIKHGEETDEEAYIFTGEDISLYHSDDSEKEDENLSHADGEDKSKKGDSQMSEETKNTKNESEETIADVFNTFNEKQKNVVYALIGQALEDAGAVDDEDDEGGKGSMKHNIFDTDYQNSNEGVLTHSDQQAILSMARQSNVGSLQTALSIYTEENESLAHGIDEIETLFPDYKDVRPGAPEKIERDLGWVGIVMNKVHKSPISRIRTRQADVRGADLRANGYKKGKYKEEAGNIKLLKRTTDPQTVYRKDKLERDDINDITDFDVVEYQYGIMKDNLNEDLALAIMVGDGREVGDEMKIEEEHIRPIWKDNELYTIHADVDVAAARNELQGTDTAVHFGDNYVYAEAIITAALYSREQYKGSGNLDFYCTPHLLNVMLLARDMNGRRIYDSKTDLAAALNVGNIVTCEQFEGLTRKTEDGKTKKLLGIFVNLSDYQVGSTKGGEITRFEQFDIDFNQYKYLIETRCSGALVKIKSAIALEEPVD